MIFRLLPAIFTGIVASMLSFYTLAQSNAGLDTDKQKFSYALGIRIGQSFARQNLTDVDIPSLTQAIQDVLSDAPLKLSAQELQAVVEAYQQKRMKERLALAEKNKKAGEAFLAENKKKKDVVELPNGLQYKVLEAGEGKKPEKGDTVVVNYRGTLLDGTEFDSSYKRGSPATLPLTNVIKGWQEALPLMSEGAKWELYIPSDLAYGQRGAGSAIGPNETLTFNIELVEVKPKAEDSKPKN